MSSGPTLSNRDSTSRISISSIRGRLHWVRVLGDADRDSTGKVTRVYGAYLDINRRKIVELHIENLNTILRAIHAINQLILREKDPQLLIQEGCRLLVQNSGYASAFIVVVDKDQKPVLWARAIGDRSSLIAIDDEKWETLPPCCISTLPRLRVIDPVLKQNACRSCLLAGEYQSDVSICLKLKHAEIIHGYLIIAMNDEEEINIEEKDLLEEMASDIALALHVIEVERTRHEIGGRRID